MKKKVIYFVSFIAICLLCVSVFSKGEVKAVESDNNCKTYTNYYLFQDATPLGTIKEWGTSDYVTNKAFAVDVPENATISDYGQIVIIGDQYEPRDFSSDKNSTNIGSSSFYNYYAKLMGTENKSADSSVYEKEYKEGNITKIYYDKDNDVYFYASKTYVNGGETSAEYVDMPDSYNDYFTRLSPSSYGFNNQETTVYPTINFSDPTEFSASVSRNWDQYSKDYGYIPNDNSTYIFSAAVYRVVYEVCEEEDTPIIDDKKDDEKDDEKVEEKKTNKVTIHYYIADTTTKLADDFVENNVAVGEYTKSCPETLKKNSKYYDRINSSVSVEMGEDSEEELICYYNEQTYSVTINYGSDEDCTKSIKESHYSAGHKAGESMTLEVPKSIGDLAEPKIGTYASQIVNKPKLDGTTITFTMPAKDVSICVVYIPKTGSSIVKWVALIGLGALAFTVWNISKKNNEINEEV